MFMAMILIVALKNMVIDPEHANDPLWMRLSVSGFFAVALAVSYLVPIARRNVGFLHMMGMVLISGWLMYLNWANRFGPDFKAGFNILSITSVLLFDNRRDMAVFAVFSTIFLALGVGFTHRPDEAIWSYCIINIFVLIVGNVAVVARTATHSQLEIKLRQMLTIQEAAIESNSDAILLVDQDGNYLRCNTAFSQMWGIPPEVVSGNRQQQTEDIAAALVRDPQELRRIWHGMEGEMKIGELRELNFLDGRVVELYWRPMIDQDVLIGRLWLFRDITQRKQRERALLERERQLRGHNERLMEFATSFVTNAGDAKATFKEITSVSADLLQVDTVGIWFYNEASDEMELQLQYERGTGTFSTGGRIGIKQHPAYFESLYRTRVLAVSDTRNDSSTANFIEGKYSGPAVALMHAQIRAQGKRLGVVTFECAHAVRNWTQEDQHFAASVADLVSIAMATEERQRTQQQLTDSTAVLQAIFDLSETGIIVEDLGHNILKYNELYLKIWDFEAEFLETRPYPELVAACLSKLKNSQNIQEGLERIKNRPGMEYAGIMEFNDGKIVERYSKAIHVDGQLRGRVWFYLDITDRKLKENELINRNFELDSFVYRASHDLKAPLNSIMGLINLIQNEVDLEAILRYVSMMDKSVKKLDDFIRQLTQFSQDARLKLIRKSIDFRELIEDTLSDLRFMDNAGRLHVTLNVDQPVGFHSDPVRLGIVFSNFLSNAIKYQDLKKEKSTLTVSVKADTHQAVCEFEDNGVGIDPEHLEKVFDLFFRASVQATGSGLGLYITHNAIQKLGGAVRVSSKLGGGTTFTLTLPNITTEEEEAGQAMETTPDKAV